MSRRDRELLERVEIPVSTAELILDRCQPGINISPTVMVANKAIFLTPQLGWLESVALNCYTQGMMDMWEVIKRHPDLLHLQEPGTDELFHSRFE